MVEKNNKHTFYSICAALKKRINETSPALIQLLVGPRQVGKTTLLLEVAAEWEGRSLYASADSPEAALPNWREGIWRRIEAMARSGEPVVLLLDEIQYLPDWSLWLKSKFDESLRLKLPIRIVASGSSSLQLGAGARESMAGRFEKLTLSHWGAGGLAKIAGISAQEAARRLVMHGGYPGAVVFWNDPARWEAYVRDAIIEPAIGRDLLHLEKVRKPALLRQVFAVAAAYPAEILSLEKIAGLLAEKGALETISHYLELLNEAFLVAPLQKFSNSEIRRRRSSPKLIVRNNALLVAGGNTIPDPETDPDRWGRWVENACLARAINDGLDLHFWREEPWEVDSVVTRGAERYMLEVKTGRYSAEDLRGLGHAAQKFPECRPIVLCDPGCERIAEAAGFEAASWVDFLQ
jgi:predicted AAA+ superfamily ATPase